MRTSSRRGFSALAALALIAGSVAIATPAQAASWSDDPVTAPANYAVFNSGPVYVYWASTSSAYQYRVSYGVNGGPTNYWYNTNPSAAPALLGDGLYYWWVSYRTCAFSGCGYNSSSPTHYFYLDTTAPYMGYLSLSPTSPVRAATDALYLNGYVSDTTNVTTTYSIDGGAERGVRPAAYLDTTGLSSGNHSLRVSSTDSAGHSSTWSNTFVVDADAPVISDILPADGAHVAPGQVTYTASIAGHANWTLAVDPGPTGQSYTGGTNRPNGTVINSSSWVDGSTHTFALTARDAAGNSSTTQTSVVVDAVGPALAFSSPADGSLLRNWAGATGTVSDATGVRSVGLELHAASGTTCGDLLQTFPTTLTGETWRVTASALADGDYCLRLVAVDQFGFGSTKESFVSIDQTAPSMFETVSPHGWVTHSDEFSWLPSTDAHDLIYGVIVTDGHSYTSYPPTSGTSFEKDLAPGSYSWWVRAIDAANNVTDTAHQELHVIGVPALTAPAAGTWFADDLPVTWTSDVVAPGGVDHFDVEFAHGDDTFITQVDADDRALDQEFADALPDGEWTVRVRAVYGELIDELGSVNGEWTAPVAVTRDSTAPDLAIASPADHTIRSAWAGASGTLSDASDLASATLEVHQQNLGGDCGAIVGSPVDLDLDDEGGWSTDALDLPDGDYCVIVTAVDALGNSATRQVSVSIDATAPGAFSPLAPLGWNVTSGTFSWGTPADAHALSYTVHVDDGTGPVDYPASGTSLSIDLAPGDYSWSVTARDAAGNATDSGTAQLHVIGVPEVVTPDAGAAFSDQLTVSWGGDLNAPGGVDHYEVEFAHGATSFISDADADATELVQQFAKTRPDGQWTVRVRAVYGDFRPELGTLDGAWSAPVTVTRDSSSPRQLTPKDGTIQTSYEVDYSWTSVAGADHYEMRSSWNDAVDLTGQLVDGFTIPVTSAGFHATLTSDDEGWWQVRSIDADGNSSSWSDAWHLTVDHDYVAPKPTPSSDPDGATTSDGDNADGADDETATEPTPDPGETEGTGTTGTTDEGTSTDDGDTAGSGDQAVEKSTDPGFPVGWVIGGIVVIVLVGGGFFIRFLLVRRA